MSDISRITNSGISAASEVSAPDKNMRRQLLRQQYKQHLKEIKDTANEQNNEILEENTRLFEETAQGHFFSESAPNSYTSSAQRQLLAQINTQAELFSGEVSSAIVYLSSEELEFFLNLLDYDGTKRSKFKELAAKLSDCTQAEQEALIDEYARLICGNNKSQIYLMLCYLYDDLMRKKARNNLIERLKKIIDAFERQESAYLFNFFKAQNIFKSLPTNPTNAKLLDNMANISSGQLKLNSLRNSLQFISEILSDDQMDKMVSIFMKFQAQALKRISTLNDGREGKEELVNILQQERNLIILNSLYNQCKNLFKILKKTLVIEEKYIDFMAKVITIIESSVVNLDNLQNMERLIGVTNITLESNKTFIKNFLFLLKKMPQTIFYNESMREKLFYSIQNILNHINKLIEPKMSALSFLHSKNYKPNRIS